METVGVRALKANLSRYLRAVQAGEELEVVSRGRIIARLVGVRHRGQSSVEDAISGLAADGLVELPESTRSRARAVRLIPSRGRPTSLIVSKQRR